MSRTKEFYFDEINHIDDMIDDEYFYQRWLDEQTIPLVCTCEKSSRLGSVDAHGKMWCVCGKEMQNENITDSCRS